MLAPVPAATSRHCILSKDDSEIKFPWRLKVLSPRLFSDVPNTIWMLAPAELSAFVVGPRECLDRVYGYERPSVAAKLF